MNLQSLYQNLQERILDTALSVWSTGDAPMQQYMRQILKEEKLLAKPIFQNMFPWEPYDKPFGALTDIFNERFITRLDKITNDEFRFPADRKPYLHQVNSWTSAIKDKKSILVTTGTGSGKTECFMLPVLYDIFCNAPNQEGVNAIFLYPLNALIGSQKKRMHEWCKVLGNIKYAIYNGNTQENGKQDVNSPELTSRVQIRNHPPQVLFTNPTMLEYMLVRDKDTELLDKSAGKLRWILLDEAHTLTGAKAAEMALLIRRVIQAFRVDVNQVRFAITSATVGNENQQELIQFMADLCGIKIEKIQLISGKRLLPHVGNEVFSKHHVEPTAAQELRQEIHKASCISVSEIGKIMGVQNEDEQIELIDRISEIKENDQSVLPIRGHFFARNIGGIYACTNPNCDIHSSKPTTIIGTLTTIAKKSCSCGYPLLELVSCRSCGTNMMKGEKKNGSIQQDTRQQNDFFQVDDEDIDDDNHVRTGTTNRFYLVKSNSKRPFIDKNIIAVHVEKNGKLNYDPDSSYFEVNENCPHCGNTLEKPFHFRLSAAFLNRVIADVILEQTNKSETLTAQMLWEGRKYIAFTDSRQGAAKIAALINIDNENYFVRSQVFHLLSKQYKNENVQLTEEERLILIQEKQDLEVSLSNLPAAVQALTRNRIIEINKRLEQTIPPRSNSRMRWSNILDCLTNTTDAKNLFFHNINGNYDVQGRNYVNSMLYNEFGRRLPRERSLENLGMVKLNYIKLENLVAPGTAYDLGISNEDWRDLIKIALDYVIRYKFFYFIPITEEGVASRKHRNLQIYPADAEQTDVLKWPKFDRKRIVQNRLTLLICAGLGFLEQDQIDDTAEDRINDLLSSIWKTLKQEYLTAVDDNGGFQLRLEDKAELELTEKLWLCPVKRTLLDTTFRGFSPWIYGKLTASNIELFRIGDPVDFPVFPYPYNRDENNQHNRTETIDWINKNNEINLLKQAGLWNSLHERIILRKPIFLAGEHSAQQKKSRLVQLEEKFHEGKINILSCSTTMEMGVDIGGISAVVMSNVPPGPANYLQRAGRAGRRKEAKSIAITICPANPIGSYVMEHPAWALTHRIMPPQLSFSSSTVVERHINALLLGIFVRQHLDGISVSEQIEHFFFNNELNLADRFLTFLLDSPSPKVALNVEHLVKDTPLTDIHHTALIYRVHEHFEEINRFVLERKRQFEETLHRLLNTPGYSQNSPAYKAVNFQLRHFLKKNLLTFLSEFGFLPAGGIPTGVVSFNNKGIKDLEDNNDKNDLPAHHITKALIEYAPGSEVVIDGWVYTSAGILLKNNWGGETTKAILQHCSSCGYEHTLVSGANQIDSACPNCNENTLCGIDPTTKFTEIMEPVGFAVDLFGEKKRHISEQSNAQYIEPLLLGAESWKTEGHPIVDFRDSLPNAEIAYYNYGTGKGFSVCLECGRADANPEKLHNHKRLRGGKEIGNGSICSGNDNPFAIRNHVLLIGRFQTDFFEIRCKDQQGNSINNDSILYSLGHILSKSLCSFLAIDEQEVDFGIKKYKGYQTIFFFDTAKGGAGYVSKLADCFEDICRDALEVLRRCTCSAACTKCLIDRKSQHRIELLDRIAAIAWLELAVARTVPQDIEEALGKSSQRIIGSAKLDIAKLLNKKQIESIAMYVDCSTIDNWDAEQLSFLSHLKLKGIKIHIVFCKLPQVLTLDQKITLLQVKGWLGVNTKFSSIDSNRIGDLNRLALIELIDGSTYGYYAKEANLSLNGEWGITNNQFTFKAKTTQNETDLHPFVIEIDEKNQPVFEVFIQSPTATIASNKIFDLLVNELPADAMNKMAALTDQQLVTIRYSDRYLMTPLGCLLFIQFVHRIKCKYEVDVNRLLVTTKPLKNKIYQEAAYVSDEFMNDKERSDLLKCIAEDCGIMNVDILEDQAIPHYRFMEIQAGAFTITIRPDAGIEHGWFSKNRYQEKDNLRGNAPIPIYQKLNNSLLYTISFQQKNDIEKLS